jgi:hypothetical protein
MIEAAGRAGQEHLNARDIGGKLHIVVVKMRGYAMNDLREPVLN